MDELKKLQNDLNLKTLELNSLLEITKAIQENTPEEILYRIFHFTLLGSLGLKKFALYTFDERWICKTYHGSEHNYKSLILPQEIKDLKEAEDLTNINLKEPFSEFDLVLPVRHKSQVLAYLFIAADPIFRKEDKKRLSFLTTFSNILVVAIQNKILARREIHQKVYRKELEIAQGVQNMLVPKKLPKADPLYIEAVYSPHQIVGGDYYDYIQLDEDRFFITIADVSGKGIAAALLMSNFQAGLNMVLRHNQDLEFILKEINSQVLSNSNGERFITAFLAIVDLKKGELNYINAGHNPPILMEASGDYKLLEKGSTVLGAFDILPIVNIGKEKLSGEYRLFLYTDGLSEASNHQGDEFGVERLVEFLEKYKNSSSEAIENLLMDTIKIFKQGEPYHDDITFVNCYFKTS